MPEGHSIRIHAKQFESRFGGEKVTLWSPQGRFAEGAALLDGHVLQKADAKGKHLFLGFDDQRWLHVHLGLYGKWVFGSVPARHRWVRYGSASSRLLPTPTCGGPPRAR